MPGEILIVDDEPDIRESHRKVLVEGGVALDRIIEACDGAEGLVVLAQVAIGTRGLLALVITDQNMPRVNGDAMLRAAESLKPLSELTEHVVMIAGTEPDSLPDGVFFWGKPITKWTRRTRLAELGILTPEPEEEE